MTRTTQIIVLITITVIKFLNASVKMAIESVDLLQEMISVIRKNKSRKNMIDLLFVLLMVKIADLIISNSLEFVVDLLRIILKFIKVLEFSEGMGLLSVIAGYISSLLKISTKNIYSLGIDMKIYAVEMVNGNGANGSDYFSYRAEIAIQTGRDSIPHYGVKCRDLTFRHFYLCGK